MDQTGRAVPTHALKTKGMAAYRAEAVAKTREKLLEKGYPEVQVFLRGSKLHLVFPVTQNPVV